MTPQFVAGTYIIFSNRFIIIIIIIIIIIMDLQPFVGPWPFFKFLDPIQSQYDSLDGGSAHRKTATYTKNNINRTNEHNKDIHAFSRIRTQDPSFRATEESSRLRRRDQFDLPATALSLINTTEKFFLRQSIKVYQTHCTKLYIIWV
jgi:hypothetical protein